MRKRLLKSLIAITLTTTFVLISQTKGSLSFAATEEVPEEISTEIVPIYDVELQDPEIDSEDLEVQTVAADSEIAVYASGNVAINATNFPDPVFRQMVSDEMDIDHNGVLSDLEIGNIYVIKCSGKGVTDLTGVKTFYKLYQLYCNDNNLTSLDVRGLPLETLRCENNSLTSLEIGSNKTLKYFNCDNNNLTSLNVSGCSALTEMSCIQNKLTGLNVSGCTSLSRLYCNNNQLTSLDLKDDAALFYFECYNNQLTSLDLSKNTVLRNLYCQNNKLTSLNVSGCAKLWIMYCNNNQLTSLDLSNNNSIERLYCENNNLTSLDVSNFAYISNLHCYGNKMQTINVGDRPASQLRDIVLLNTPIIESPTLVSSGVQVTWSKSTGAKGYYIYRKEAGGSWKRIAEKGEYYTSYVDTTASNNKIYYYTVIGYREIDENIILSDYDKEGMSITLGTPPLSTPKISNVSNVNGGIKISWDKVADAKKYRIFYKTSTNSGWTKLADTTATSYTWTGAKSGTKYTFTVRCLNSAGTSYTSSYDSTGKSIKYIAAPKLGTVSNTATGVKITWGAVTGAEKYRVFYKIGNGSWTKVADTTSTSYTWTGAKSGTKYTFTVRCLNSKGTSYTSSYDSTGKNIIYLSEPKISKIEANNSGVKISWGKVTGATTYRVYYMSSSGWKLLKETSDTTYTLNAVKGNTYKYTVKAMNGSTASSYHSGTSFKRLETPKLSSVKKVSNGVKVSWGTVSGAVKYRVYYKTGNGSWTKIADTTSTSYTWTGAKKGTTYTFTVRCLSSDGTVYTSGYDTAGKTITTSK